MKTLFTLKQVIAVCSAIVITAGLFAQGGSVSKEVNKDFKVNPNTRLELSNKYGNVDIVNRKDAALSIHVVVKVNMRDRERAESMLRMVEINIVQNGDVIRATTDISEEFGRMFRGFNSGDDGLEINYTVSMPSTVPLNLSNKYGNVFIDELVSTSTIDVKYGKLTANRIFHDSKEPLTKIFLSYSNGTITEAKWIELDIKYSKLGITDSKALAVLSKYSKLNVGNGTSIVSESKYDTYEIGTVTNFITTAAYGHFTIKELSGKLQVDTKYSDVIVDRIPQFEVIKITNSYGSYKLGISPSAAYKLNGYAKYCSIDYPENNARVSRFNENNEMKVNGTVGGTANPTAEVSVSSHYGNIRLIP